MQRWTVTAAAATLAVMSAAVGVVTVLGWMSGDRLAAPAVVLGGCAFFTAVFAFVAVRDRRDAQHPDSPLPSAPAPEPDQGPIVLAVRHRLGLVFWLHTSIAAAFVGAAGWLIATWWSDRVAMNVDLAASEWAALGSCWVRTCVLVLFGGLAAILPRRMWHARTHTPLWLSATGIGYIPTRDGDPGYLSWWDVAAVHYSSTDIDMTPIIYKHRWRLDDTASGPARVISYPLGASPRPRRIRRTIRRLSPMTTVHGWW